ncbi:MAG: hypothetical protein IJT73_02965 [Selenomonadaceae bacterium]|nr:hypothetical protein [Selenomonadaceae bacterium]
MLRKFLGAAFIFSIIFFGVAQEVQAMQIKITIGGKTFDAVLEDNQSARAFYEKLPLEITMTELNGNEKYYRLGKNLPSNDTRVGNIHAGDLMLWSSNTVVLFYQNFSSGYSYTRLGKILNPANLSETLGKGNIGVKFTRAI